MPRQTKPTTAGESVPVTVDNFVRAESDWVLGGLVRQGALGKFEHFRELTPIDKQVVHAPTATHSIRRRCSISRLGP